MTITIATITSTTTAAITTTRTATITTTITTITSTTTAATTTTRTATIITSIAIITSTTTATLTTPTTTITASIITLFEAIVNQKIFNQVKNRITCNQHGFYKGRSTATNLLEFVDFSLASMDRGNFVETLYTDFSKAFDRVDISMLMFKLKKLGFESGLLKWIESYLTGHKRLGLRDTFLYQ